MVGLAGQTGRMSPRRMRFFLAHRAVWQVRVPGRYGYVTTNTRRTDYAYDGLGRVLSATTYDRATGADVWKDTSTTTYNLDGSAASVAFDDSVLAGTDDTLAFTYDGLGRADQITRGATVLTDHAWNDDGTLASRVDGTLGTTTFAYDWAQRTTSVTPPTALFGATPVTRAYRLDGLLASQAFPNGLTETLAYDTVKRPVAITMGTTGALTQGFDRRGNVIAESRSLSGIAGDAGGNGQTFTYDGLRRLTGSTGLATASAYTYDLDGNRLTATDGPTTTTYRYDRADQLIDATAGTTAAFAYDPYGDLTTSRDAALGATTYTYDGVGHLATIVPPAGPTIALHTDALGRVRDRTTTSTDTYAYVGASGTASAVATSGGTTTAALVDPAGGRLGLNTAGTVRWSLADLHGSTAALAAAGSPAIGDAYRYDGWGRTVATAGSAPSPWRYRGLLDLGPAGDPLYAMGARLYSPGLGTFTQRDTYPGSPADPLGLNRYLYAEANPATLVDPDGHRACETDPCASYTDTGTAGSSVAQSGGTGPTISPYAIVPFSVSVDTPEPRPEPAPPPCTPDECPGMFPLPPAVAPTYDDRKILHTSLDICGWVLAPCAAADAGLYAVEDDAGGAIFTAIGLFPAGKALRHAPQFVLSLLAKAERLTPALSAAHLLKTSRTLVIEDFAAMSFGEIVYEGSLDLRPTLSAIATGRETAWKTFKNVIPEGLETPVLPAKPPGYYSEFRVPMPGSVAPGPIRLVMGRGGEVYLTAAHYTETAVTPSYVRGSWLRLWP
jgi:RHS repeat-associated protein